MLREMDSMSSSPARHTLRFDPTAMVLNDPVADRESEISAIAIVFGGKKGLKNPGNVLRVYSGSSI